MLDRLLGRASLKTEIERQEARIEELETECEKLREQLSAEQDRRKTAVKERQDAQERANRLEDRIAQLEGEVERLREDEGGPTFRGLESLGPRRTGTVVDRLGSVRTDPEGALTAFVDGELPATVGEAFGDRSPLVARAAPCLAVTDDAGLVSAALRPPDPPDPFVDWDDRFRVDREWFVPSGEFALALVRADVFAIGEYEGEERVSFRGFESDVKGDHSKGGFSQARFERIRDEQIDQHIDRCREAIAERDHDRLYVVGDRGAIAEFEEGATVTRPVDATGDPEPALETAFQGFWTTRLSLI